MAGTNEIEFFSGFYRGSFSSGPDFYLIGGGEIGGKASGLAFIKKIVSQKLNTSKYPNIDFVVPKTAVLRTGAFEAFMKRNSLSEIALSGIDENSIAWDFQKGSLPAELVGDLRDIIIDDTKPLAIRSSSMLEDSLSEPFAGIYNTKMIANNSPSSDERFRKLNEAIKFVYASTYSNAAKSYFASIDKDIASEQMAVLIQEVAGSRHKGRFYPQISGVARSYNYYPTGNSVASDGVVNLAIGLGKAIVDGGICWVYSPRDPVAPSPFADPGELMKMTQNNFWAVNTDLIMSHEPTKEDEFLISCTLAEAEEDGILDNTASTFVASSNKVVMGIGNTGPRIIDFAPLLRLNTSGFNDFLNDLIKVCEDEVKNPVEIEFAVDIDDTTDKITFSLVQLRPMMVSKEKVVLNIEELPAEEIIVFSERALGNGVRNEISDVVYLKKESFDLADSMKIAKELEQVNSSLLKEGKKMLLIGFGRWGSSDRWLGVPVTWGQISSARAIVEQMLPGINIDLSQGSHFFHNLLAFRVPYFCLKGTDDSIDWRWLDSQPVMYDSKYVKHVRTLKPVTTMVDGTSGKGVIMK